MSDPAAINPTPDRPSPDDGDERFEAASQSLTAALNVSFRALRWLFLLLLGVFVFSGCFTVDASQVAVRTTFGKIDGANGADYLTSEGGPYFRWPRPIGEVYFVPTQARTIRLNDAFVFRLGPNDRFSRLDEVSAGPRLDPALDGMLITGDVSIVHARYDVTYRVRPQDAADFVRELAGPTDFEDWAGLADDEDLIFERADELVRSVVEAAVVADTARKSIDTWLRGSLDIDVPDPSEEPADPTEPADAEEPVEPVEPDEGEAVPEPIRQPPVQPSLRSAGQIASAAQARLDELGVGLTIDSVLPSERTVPPVMRPSFEAFAAADQLRRRALTEGEARRRAILTEAAGAAYPAVLTVIDVYEAAEREARLDPDNAEAAALAEASQSALEALFTGTPAAQVLNALANELASADPRADLLRRTAAEVGDESVGGRAFAILQAARAESTNLSRLAQGEVRRFESLLPDYRRSPDLVKRQLFFNTLGEILSRPDVKIKLVSPVGDLVIDVPEDPDIERQDRERATNLRRANQQRQGR